MATEQSLTCLNLVAATDLSAKQFYIVKVDSNGRAALCSAVTDQPIGVLQNAAGSLGAASVAIAGKSKLSGGAALTIGQQIASDANGQGTAITVAAGGTVYNYVVGRVVTASAGSAGIAEVVLYTGGLPLLV